ncbi:M24 family metallopeptidase [Listeria booriae]|uniref:M24 family metallopeptidase n=1 Tax=Listeria booriae TaxID=1552123 RepID=UPI0017AB14C1|nr:M24 family metallopeptidase [Listeria booriae]MBC2325106.1 M24 family metallopeptidase [Listeria booriae]
MIIQHKEKSSSTHHGTTLFHIHATFPQASQYVTQTNDTPLQENMVFTIEPGIYVPGVAGVRIEDDIVVTKDGYEILTEYPKELIHVK